MRLIVTADLHFRLVDSLGINVSGVNSRLTDKINTATAIISYAIETQAEGFVILGDLFDKINPSEKLRKIFAKTVINPLLQAKIPIIILMGNHDTNYDIVSFETEASVVNAMSDDALTFITTPTILDFGKQQAYFIPYGSEIPLQNEGCSVCFAHHGIQGAETGVGVVYRAGEELDYMSFHAFPVTFSGHYHKPQIIHKRREFSFVYVGSPNVWDMGERADEKRFIDLDLSDSVSWKSIPLPDRRFIKMEVKEGESWEFTEDIKDAIVVVDYSGSKSWIRSLNFEDMKKHYQRFQPHNIILKPKPIEQERNLVISVTETDTEEEIIRKFCAKKGIDAQSSQVGLDIFNSI